MARVLSEKAIFQVREELLNLEPEDASNKIWPVIRLLPGKEVSHDFRPSRVNRKGNKEGRLLKVTDDGHGILKELLYKPVPARKGG
jgi:hypothetical protein